jgi:hypothetical protein
VISLSSPRHVNTDIRLIGFIVQTLAAHPVSLKHARIIQFKALVSFEALLEPLEIEISPPTAKSPAVSGPARPTYLEGGVTRGIAFAQPTANTQRIS